MQKMIEWSIEKNLWLLKNRKVCFEEVVAALESGNLLAKLTHPSQRYAHQYLYIVYMKEYVYVVPVVEDDKKIFLKTIVPSRLFAKRYLKTK